LINYWKRQTVLREIARAETRAWRCFRKNSVRESQLRSLRTGFGREEKPSFTKRLLHFRPSGEDIEYAKLSNWRVNMQQPERSKLFTEDTGYGADCGG
jgi:hypothetical protein